MLSSHQPAVEIRHPVDLHNEFEQMNELDIIALNSSIPLLREISGVTVCGEWAKEPISGIWFISFGCTISGYIDNRYIKPNTEWLLTVDFAADCIGKVTIYPGPNEHDLKATFPHQMFNGKHHKILPCRTGNLCTATGFDSLSANRNAAHIEPLTTIPRIEWHVMRTIYWLKLAVTDQLSPVGSLFELPDFNFESSVSNALLAYYEDEASFHVWNNCPHKMGVVEINALFSKTSYIARAYFDLKKKDSVYEPQWGTAIQQQSTTLNAIWIRLDGLLCVNNYQVPSNIGELKQAIAACGFDYDLIIEKSIRYLPESGETLFVIGMPIPRHVGGMPYSYHWQALRIAPPRLKKISVAARIPLIKHHLKMDKKDLEWIAKAENWHPAELVSRGSLSNALINCNVVLIGAGALGSVLAEQLVRMGLRKLVLIDNDLFESGNLVRHSLTMSDIGNSKVEALRKRLAECNPSVVVEVLNDKVIDNPSLQVQKAFEYADLIVDATADDNLLHAMPIASLACSNIPFISCSLSLHADRLFLYSSAADKFDWTSFNRWFQPFREEQSRLAESIELPRTAGCWHPLTPARYNRVSGLSGMAIEYIEKIMEDKPQEVFESVIVWPSVKN